MTTNEALADTSDIGDIRDPYLEYNARGGNGYNDRGEITLDAPEETLLIADSRGFVFNGLKRTISTLRSEFTERAEHGVSWLADRQRTRQAAKALGIFVTAGATAAVARKVVSNS